MPLPKPQSGESETEFISRCMDDSAMTEEYEATQRLAICHSLWTDKAKSDADAANATMLGLLHDRKCRNVLHGYGVRTADEYVSGVVQCLQLPDAERTIKESCERLVYSNEDTTCESVLAEGDLKEYVKRLKVDLPPRTLTIFEAVVTTPRKDRDGDILRTEGAIVDPDMPTLWHHMLPMPIGRLLSVVLHNKQRLKIASTLVDNALGADTAHLMEHGALRISHGFRPLKFEALKTRDDEPPGFDIQKFEILETSTVTVPSNSDAIITAYGRGKLHDPTVKRWAEQQYEARPSVHSVIIPPQLDGAGQQTLTTEAARMVSEAVKGSILPQAPAEQDKVAVPSHTPPREDDLTTKAGRVLSKRNEDRLRRAHEMVDNANAMITEVLSQLSDDEEEKHVPVSNSNSHSLETAQIVRQSIGQAVRSLGRELNPVRWNPSTSKAFDAAREPAPAAILEYDWVSRYLQCPIKDIFEQSCSLASARMGSFLAALDEITREHRIEGTRNITYEGGECPPVYEVIQLNSRTSRDFLIEGMSFQKTPRYHVVIKRTPVWWGIRITVYTSIEHRAANTKLFTDAFEWASQHNFLKGEAFSLSGDFLPKTPEKWEDVFLTETNTKSLRRATELLNTRGRVAPNRGTLLMGPPGTGKTLSGRVIMNTVDSTFIWISSRDFYYAGTFGGLTYGFDLARELAPSVLFIEDIDNWLDSRSVDLIKTEMDGVGRSTGVLTVLTTNYPERLPDALIDRPGRFHDVLKFDLPDASLRRRMLKNWLASIDEKALARAVKETDGYSGAHLHELAEYARTIQDTDGLSLNAAVFEALKKIHEQRELINQAQLAGSNYQPRKFLFAGSESSSRIASLDRIRRSVGDGVRRALRRT